MKLMGLIFIIVVVFFLTFATSNAAPLVFEFEANSGANSTYNGSTIILQGPSDLTGANFATDLLGFDIITGTNQIVPGPGVTARLSTSSPFSVPFTYTATNLVSGILVINTGPETGVNITAHGLEYRPVILEDFPDLTTPGTWILETASPVPEINSTLLLFALALAVLLGFHSCSTIRRASRA